MTAVLSIEVEKRKADDNRQVQINLAALACQETRQKFGEAFDQHLSNRRTEGEAQAAAHRELTQAFHHAASAVLPTTQAVAKRPWISSETLRLI